MSTLTSALLAELATLSDDELRPLAERLAAFTPVHAPAPAYLSVGQAAERLGVHPNTVYRMIDAGRLAGIRVGRLWRIPEPELDRAPSAAPAPQRRAAPRAHGDSGRRFAALVRDLP